MAKISVSLDDNLAAELRDSAGENVSAFVARAVRRQLDREQLGAFLVELEEDLGPVTAEEAAEAAAAFDRVTLPAKKAVRKSSSAARTRAVAARRRS
jgi:hypothetical protein